MISNLRSHISEDEEPWRAACYGLRGAARWMFAGWHWWDKIVCLCVALAFLLAPSAIAQQIQTIDATDSLQTRRVKENANFALLARLVGATPGSVGTVTSVGFSAPAGIFSVSGSPVLSVGVIGLGLVNQNANTVFAGPLSGLAGTPGFRGLVAADLPLFGASGTGHSAGAVPDPGATQGTLRYLREDRQWVAPPGGGGGSGGTVTSVALGMPGEFSVSGSPVVNSGTLSAAWANQNSNLFFAGPGSGSAATPGFRGIVAADLPLFGASGGSHSAGVVPDPGGTPGSPLRYLREDRSWANPVTSVSLTMPGIFGVSGGPVTSAGGFTVTFNNQSANQFFGGPASGGAAGPTFRAIGVADLPVMQPSGSGHAAGLAPDPGATAGLNKFLRDDATYQVVMTALNGQTGASQSFATDGTGSDVSIASAANVHTFHFPSASGSARGLVTTGPQTFGGSKTFSGNTTTVNHIAGSGTASIGSTGTGGGTGGSASISGSDLSGQITVATGSGPATTAPIATVNFSSTYDAVPTSVLVLPANDAAANLAIGAWPRVRAADITTSSFILRSGTTALGSATYQWYYVVHQ